MREQDVGGEGGEEDGRARNGVQVRARRKGCARDGEKREWRVCRCHAARALSLLQQFTHPCIAIVEDEGLYRNLSSSFQNSYLISQNSYPISHLSC